MIGRTNSSNGSSTPTAAISVSASDFIGESITCTNGGTYTKISTVSAEGKALFNVGYIGDYTVSVTLDGKTYSESVTVSEMGTQYEVSISKEITLTLTVYSAASDTVYYYAENNTSTSPITLCTTDANGKAEGVEFIVMPNTTIKFYSSIAKQVADSSKPFEKEITFVDGMTELDILPKDRDAMLLWYGATYADFGEDTTKYGTEGSFQFYGISISRGTNCIELKTWNGSHYGFDGQTSSYISMLVSKTFSKPTYTTTKILTSNNTISNGKTFSGTSFSGSLTATRNYFWAGGTQYWNVQQTEIFENTQFGWTKVYGLWVE